MPESRIARATITDVAQLAGVAISSASAALNGRPGVSPETRIRVREAAEELQYVPSLRGRSLSSKRAFAIGLIVERDFNVLEVDPFFSAFIGGIQESLAPQGYALLLQIVDGDHSNLARHLELADSRRVDGVILSELRVDDARIPAFQSRGTPVVGINPAFGFPFPAVRQDNTVAVRALVRAMRALGHERMAHVAGPATYVHSIQRHAAWREAMMSEDLRPDLVIEGDFTHDGGVAAAEAIIGGSDLPTAVFCANDLMAIGFMNRMTELGLRVPKDISVAGFDGIRLGTYVRPTLTTIATAPHTLGREAARLLLDAIDGRPVTDVIVEPSSLVLRKSTANASQ